MLWVLLLGLAVPTAMFDLLCNGLVVYSHFTVLDSPLHGLGYSFLGVCMCTVWPMIFFMIWNLVSCSSGT